jgi:large subunit ribosomal protein L27Ae
MRYFHKQNNKFHCPTINLDKIWTLVDAETQAKYCKANVKAPLVIDVSNYGIFKVLGKGGLPDAPIVVRAKFFSKGAQTKILAKGGACELTA